MSTCPDMQASQSWQLAGCFLEGHCQLLSVFIFPFVLKFRECITMEVVLKVGFTPKVGFDHFRNTTAEMQLLRLGCFLFVSTSPLRIQQIVQSIELLCILVLCAV
jgi:hypothetical protein